MTGHVVRRYADDRGWVACCRCGWHAVSADRADLDRAATEHKAHWPMTETTTTKGTR